MYTSRRTKNYNDNDSNGEEGEQQDTAVITFKDTQGNVITMKPNPRFKPYTGVFKRLVKTQQVCTPHIVVSMKQDARDDGLKQKEGQTVMKKQLQSQEVKIL